MVLGGWAVAWTQQVAWPMGAWATQSECLVSSQVKWADRTPIPGAGVRLEEGKAHSSALHMVRSLSLL